MKTIVEIWDASIMTSNLFESKIAKLINDGLYAYGYENVKVIELSSIGMGWKGHGQYNISMLLTVDRFEAILSRHSTDSQLYDRIHDADTTERTLSNDLKRMALSVLEFQLENLVDDLIDVNIVKKMEVMKNGSHPISNRIYDKLATSKITPVKATTSFNNTEYHE